jgi:hypothetical protein
MMKKKVLLVTLLLVFGVGLSASVALAQGTLTATTTVYTLRPNSNAEAVGPVYLGYVAGDGVFGIGQSLNVLYSAPIVGASKVASVAPAIANADFCSTGGTSTLSCTSLTVTATGNTLTLTNETLETLTWTAGNITIYGVRVNTWGMAPSAEVTAQVYTSVSPSYPLWTLSNGTNLITTIVGTVSATTAVTVSPNNNNGNEGDSYSCVGVVPYSPPEYGGNEMWVVATENWAGAWSSQVDELTLAPFAPVAPNYTVTNGSNIAIAVVGIPKGVTVTPVAPFNYIGGQAWGATPPAFTSTADDSNATFVYTILSTDRAVPAIGGTPEESEFDFVLSSNGALPDQNNPPTTTSVTLAPAVSGASYPAFSYPVFGNAEEAPGVPYTIWLWPDCQTTLAYPYVTNYNGGPGAGPLGNWDTAIEVANMSSIPPASLFSSIPTNGACTFSFYNAGTSKTVGTAAQATPLATYTTPVLLSGGEYAFMLSSVAPGFAAGSAWAVCNFLDGTGYAAIADNANGLGNWELFANYLAIDPSAKKPPTATRTPASMRMLHK